LEAAEAESLVRRRLRLLFLEVLFRLTVAFVVKLYLFVVVCAVKVVIAVEMLACYRFARVCL
jgi:hypothetical protein